MEAALSNYPRIAMGREWTSTCLALSILGTVTAVDHIAASLHSQIASDGSRLRLQRVCGANQLPGRLDHAVALPHLPTSLRVIAVLQGAMASPLPGTQADVTKRSMPPSWTSCTCIPGTAFGIFPELGPVGGHEGPTTQERTCTLCSMIQHLRMWPLTIATTGPEVM